MEQKTAVRRIKRENAETNDIIPANQTASPLVCADKKENGKSDWTGKKRFRGIGKTKGACVLRFSSSANSCAPCARCT